MKRFGAEQQNTKKYICILTIVTAVSVANICSS